MGHKHSLKITNIQSIEIISPRIPWVSISLSIMVLLVISGFILSRVPYEFVFMIVGILVLFLPMFLAFMIFAQKAVI